VKTKDAADLNEYPLFSKYNSGFTYNPAPKKNLATPTIAFLEDRIEGNKRYLKIRITPNRTVNRYDIFANEKWLSTILLLMVRLH
jgi:hypothetical protein